MATFARLQELFCLEGKVVVVTGASSGIGKAAARLLAEAGGRVVITNRDAAAGEQVAKGMRIEGLDATAIAADVGSEESVSALFKKVADTFGSTDILVNNAGITPKKPIAEISGDEWDMVQDVNLRGAFLCLREASRQMQAAGRGGRIINVSSTSSLHPGVYGNTAYAASKGGLNSLTRAAALDLAADAITVNAVLPGGTMTEGVLSRRDTRPTTGPATEMKRYLFGRLGESIDPAAAILYFASPAAAYVTGQLLAVDGGFMVG